MSCARPSPASAPETVPSRDEARYSEHLLRTFRRARAEPDLSPPGRRRTAQRRICARPGLPAFAKAFDHMTVGLPARCSSRAETSVPAMARVG